MAWWAGQRSWRQMMPASACPKASCCEQASVESDCMWKSRFNGYRRTCGANASKIVFEAQDYWAAESMRVPSFAVLSKNNLKSISYYLWIGACPLIPLSLWVSPLSCSLRWSRWSSVLWEMGDLTPCVFFTVPGPRWWVWFVGGKLQKNLGRRF